MLEVRVLNIVVDLVFELNDLRKQLADDLLLLVLLGTFLKPSEVIMFRVVEVSLLVEGVKWSTVAALEDELLSLLDVHEEAGLLLLELFDPGALLLPLGLSLLLLLDCLFLLLLLGVCDVVRSTLKLLLEPGDLLPALLLVGTSEGRESFLELIKQLLGGVDRIDFVLFSSLFLVVDSIPLLLLEENGLVLLTEIVELLVLQSEFCFQLPVLLVYLGKTLLVFCFQASLELCDVFAFLLVQLVDHLTDQSVWQVFLEDCVLLLKLLSEKVLVGVDITVLPACLDLPLGLGFLLGDVVFDVLKLLRQFLVDTFNLVQVSLLLRRVELLVGDRLQASLLRRRILTGVLHSLDLLLHHGLHVLSQLHRLLLEVLQVEILQLFVVLVSDKTLDSTWNLLRRKLKFHL